MIETDTIEELKVGQIALHGLEYAKKVLLSCPSLRVFHAEVVDLTTLTKNKATLTDADYDYSGHGPPPPTEDAEPLDEEGEAKLEAKKKERLKKLMENNYDSDDEEVSSKKGAPVDLPAATEVDETAAPEDDKPSKSEAAQEVAALLGTIL